MGIVVCMVTEGDGAAAGGDRDAGRVNTASITMWWSLSPAGPNASWLYFSVFC